jgi:hypothetical protein
MSPYKGKPSAKTIAREFPFVVEVMVPEGGLGRRLDDMHAFHPPSAGSPITTFRADAMNSTITCWCFKDVATAEAFAAQFLARWYCPNRAP